MLATISVCASRVSGDTVVVGAMYEDSSATGVDGDQDDDRADLAGAAYVFVRTGSTWSQETYLKASNTDLADRFGYSVAVSGDTVVVGARDEDIPTRCSCSSTVPPGPSSRSGTGFSVSARRRFACRPRRWRRAAGPCVDLTGGGFLPGTRYFQCWYLDPAAGGAGFNLSDGLEVEFAP